MEKNNRKLRSEDINPCLVETDASRMCMEHHGYERDRCGMYFQNYKNCRKYWHNIMIQRRRDGVKPEMPTAAERQEMLAALGRKPY
ncbi:coiled-coil-helix-coiled-coil-helix domain-containing protein 7 [Eucyclogobius newberryi]|uniref:coiled-coil-helix-coiled-coil-helix domain-containing protein 7 n=1 Tax=Eucyclogobius newberryi TaxID=166745 RepID=UPI003B5C55F4